ncbi:unnamed protein product [Larinioides sclopetarius]|uniref:Uncharacterized protein n=1 Tax=Larinioides sclopetarius TaxID=280406 RepID=A0AAV2BXZ0_9ARAC
MRNINLMKPVLCLLMLMVTAIATDLSLKEGCPKSSDVQPCKCESGQYTVLQCNHIENTDTLWNVFRKSTKYAFQEVHIQFSAFLYLPRDIFEIVPVKSLYLKNTTLSTLFDQPPQSLDALDTLHLENALFMRYIGGFCKAKKGCFRELQTGISDQGHISQSF